MRKFLTLAFFLLFGFSTHAYARPANKMNFNGQILLAGDSLEKRNLSAQVKTLSFREIVQIINSRIPGKASDARESFESGRKVFIVRWEPSSEALRGKIFIFVVDAETGQILRQSGG